MIEQYVRAALAVIPLFGLIGIIAYILVAGLPPKGEESSLLLMLAGVLASLAKEGSGYYLGSSQGSADKTTALIETNKRKQ